MIFNRTEKSSLLEILDDLEEKFYDKTISPEKMLEKLGKSNHK